MLVHCNIQYLQRESNRRTCNKEKRSQLVKSDPFPALNPPQRPTGRYYAAEHRVRNCRLFDRETGPRTPCCDCDCDTCKNGGNVATNAVRRESRSRVVY